MSMCKKRAERKRAEGSDRMPIVAENLNSVYNKGQPDETYALRDVSFSVEDGEFTGIIGHTGSGKSTLIQHLNGLLRPDSGRIFIDGYEITAKDAVMRDIRRKVGLVFQYPEYQLFEETVEKDVAYGPKNMGLPSEEIQVRVREALALTGLDYDLFAARSPFELSGGQKRRVAIAGVLAMRPDVLILDEPAAGLDPQSHSEILSMIGRIREERGVTVLLVSHNMDDVARLCDRVLVMDGGKLLLSGTPREVFSRADILQAAGLGLPAAADLIRRMREMGADIDGDVLFPREAAERIARWRSEGSPMKKTGAADLLKRQMKPEEEKC